MSPRLRLESQRSIYGTRRIEAHDNAKDEIELLAQRLDCGVQRRALGCVFITKKSIQMKLRFAQSRKRLFEARRKLAC